MVRIRYSVPSDLDGILSLLRLSLGDSDSRTSEFWNWKHESSPFGRSPVLVAEVDDRIIGLRAFMRWRWKIGDSEVPAYRAVDTATHPDFQGRGVFRKLTLELVARLASEGGGFVFNTPNSKSRPGYLKMGWRVLGRPTIWVRCHRPLRVSHAALRRLLGSGRMTASKHLPCAEGSTVEELLTSRTFERIEGHDSNTEQFRTAKTMEFLEWRYARSPKPEYRALWAESESAAAAVLFRLSTRGELRELRLCEMLASRSKASKELVRSLVHDLARSLRPDLTVALNPPGNGRSTRFSRIGLYPMAGTGPVVTVRRIACESAQIPAPSRIRELHASLGDLELF